MIKGILFDLDGTLINTNELIINSYQHTLKSLLNLDVSGEEIIQYFGEPLKITLGRYCTQEQLSRLVEYYRKYNIENHDRLTKCFPNVYATLRTLKSKGLKLAVVTSKMRDTALRGLSLCQLTDFFDIVITYEDTEEHKPTAAPILKALNELRLKSNEVLMVGDSPNDIQSAHNAGIKCVIVEYSVIDKDILTKYRPDYWIQNFKEIPCLICKAFF